MSRSMIESNTRFFENLALRLDEDLAIRVANSKRYIQTNGEEKEWLKFAALKFSFRFSRDVYALLLSFNSTAYLCLINMFVPYGATLNSITECTVNSGLVTLLGSEGYITPKLDRQRQQQILTYVLYDTSDMEYCGHSWDDIREYFPPIFCYEVQSVPELSDISDNQSVFYKLLSQVVHEFGLSNNPYSEISNGAWEKILYETDISKISFKNLLQAYTALSWDITYLYLYQCLEDKFTIESVYSLHKTLSLSISEQDFSRLLYDELSWQPRDVDSIEKIISRIGTNSKAVQIINEINVEGSPAKFIYRMRNCIVHETRDALLAQNENEKWEKVITGLLYLLIEI